MPRKSPINQLNTNGALVVLRVWSWQTTGSHIASSSTHCEGVFCFRIFRSDNGYRTANDYQFAHHHGAEKGRRDLASPESVIFQSIPPPTTRPSVNAKILLVSLRSMMKTFCNWQYSQGMWMSDWMTGWRRTINLVEGESLCNDFPFRIPSTCPSLIISDCLNDWISEVGESCKLIWFHYLSWTCVRDSFLHNNNCVTATPVHCHYFG